MRIAHDRDLHDDNVSLEKAKIKDEFKKRNCAVLLIHNVMHIDF